MTSKILSSVVVSHGSPDPYELSSDRFTVGRHRRRPQHLLRRLPGQASVSRYLLTSSLSKDLMVVVYLLRPPPFTSAATSSPDYFSLLLIRPTSSSPCCSSGSYILHIFLKDRMAPLWGKHLLQQ
jgi:hypothetical protein